jgi:hypothetical protein
LNRAKGNRKPPDSKELRNFLVGSIFPLGMPELSGIKHSTSVILFFLNHSI